MYRTSLLALLIAVAAGPAAATGEVYCEAPGASGAVFSYGFGSVPGIALVNATIRVEGQRWSLIEADGAIPMSLAQASLENRRTLIDFADPNMERIVASVRLLSAVEGDDTVTVGTLHIPGTGVFPLLCD
ncbi:MAG: hypothetical protein JJ938_09030 [Roseicyclus sp.]|uniref:hypothetical protein n=1 Tax=Boseongicola sp. H5 TaxID=2763261 RepID=UPI001B22FF34|nr:hypothetical protein [Boseongicola sp. H5]MBO6604344.1 hypothetical protein [Roseicyclus sp.]MBO6625010.1 hypothetical protein [Roseicyclus sp.]MBO6923298.1 hypothetical protein [Roseicyclus sp.]